MSWHIEGGPRYPFEQPPDCIRLEHDDLGDEVRYFAERTCRDFGGQEGTNGEDYDFACSACGWCGDVAEPRFCPNCGARVECGTA